MSQDNNRLDNVRRRLNFDDEEKQERKDNTSTEENTATNKRQNGSLEMNKIDNIEELVADKESEVKITDLSAMNAYEKMEFMKRWNFDFENEVPLEGDWEWEKTKQAETLNHKEKVVACFSKDYVNNKDV